MTTRKSPGKHTIEVTFEAKWGVTAHMICHEAVSDPERPCWTHDEDGTPWPQDRGEKAGCVYLDWFDNDGLESLGGPDVKVHFALGDAEWDGGCFTFILGELEGRRNR